MLCTAGTEIDSPGSTASATVVPSSPTSRSAAPTSAVSERWCTQTLVAPRAAASRTAGSGRVSMMCTSIGRPQEPRRSLIASRGSPSPPAERRVHQVDVQTRHTQSVQGFDVLSQSRLVQADHGDGELGIPHAGGGAGMVSDEGHGAVLRSGRAGRA